MKLYTKRGDDGSTGLFGGQRVAKDSLRVETYGTVDELNAALGLAAVACRHEDLRQLLTGLQARLFDLGSDLASPRARQGAEEEEGVIPRIAARHVHDVEKLIDQVWNPLPPMQTFILPGGSELAARLHLVRTICRRAERLCVALGKVEPLGDHVVVYLNRLSDLFFALARRANQLEGVEDVPWKK